MLPVANQKFFINIHALSPFVILFIHCKQWLMQLPLPFASRKQQAVEQRGSLLTAESSYWMLPNQVADSFKLWNLIKKFHLMTQILVWLVT